MNELLRAQCEKALEKVAEVLRAEMPRFVSLEADGSGPPRTIALRDAFLAFPCPSQLLLIDALEAPSPRDAARWWTLVRFDLSRPQTNEVTFAAEVKAVDLPKDHAILEEHFGEDRESMEPICNLTLLGGTDEHLFTVLSPLDVRAEPEKYGVEVAKQIAFHSTITEMFVREIDFTTKYGLQADEVLSAADLLKIDPTTAHFTNIETSLPVSLEERQRSVADIQLIP